MPYIFCCVTRKRLYNTFKLGYVYGGPWARSDLALFFLDGDSNPLSGESKDKLFNGFALVVLKV